MEPSRRTGRTKKPRTWRGFSKGFPLVKSPQHATTS